MSHVVTVPELLDGHTVLGIECLDRIYLNGYVPALQVGSLVLTFMHDRRGCRSLPRRCSRRSAPGSGSRPPGFADINDIQMIKFRKGVRKIGVMRQLLARTARTARAGVAGIG
jgi:hypothetical protein